ncbi:MAG: DUF1624 domain-containing protein [Oscillospiraceae bacterium]|jgi:uncharacterized membrane protein|nr:DUF1624 domain-containing protein [Oscillospiraceae bacterium]
MQQNNTAPDGRGRIYLMDELRGFAVFCMVFYHGFYTFGYLFGSDVGIYFFRFFMPAEPFFAGMFLFISGVCSNLTHSNLARGIKLLAVSLGVTLATWIFVPEDVITFGVLHFLSVCMILFGLLKPAADRFRFSWTPVLVCAALYFAARGVPNGYLGYGAGLGVPLPQSLYTCDWLAPLGLTSPNFVSSDYFPLLPWIFVFAAGTFVGKLAKQGRFPEIAYRSQVPILSWFGRHALLLYLFHQPVIYGLCLLLKACMPYLS